MSNCSQAKGGAGGGQAKGGRADNQTKGGRAGGQAKSSGGGQAKGGSGGSQAATHSPASPSVAPLQSPLPPPIAPWLPGNQSNPWGGYLNFLQQPHFPPPPPMPQQFGENSHFVGFTNNLSPPSPAPQPNDKGTRTKTVNINIDDDEGVEANKSVKKRYWTNDEEVRLVITLQLFCYVACYVALALGRQGLTPLQKCTAAIRQLAHGSEADHLDESLKIAETTAMEAMKYFVEGIRAVFGERYLRRPTMEDVERILKIGERRGFPGLFGSIDCTHWPWERCPTAWKGQFTRGDQKVPTIILEAVASHDLWIWHAFFGVAGSNNDINVLNQSTLFIEELQRRAPRVQYTVNGNQYNTAYYLADGIYSEWAVFVKSIILPISDKDKLFTQEQEGARKDIERSFGVLKHRWCVLKRPARLYDCGQLENVVLACIILHNMIVEDEKTIEAIDEILDLNEAGSTVVVEAHEFSSEDYVPFERVLERDDELKDPSAHMQLKKDLIEHIWNKKGRRLNRSTN